MRVFLKFSFVLLFAVFSSCKPTPEPPEVTNPPPVGPAFLQAEGAGMYTTGGRGGTVYVVTRLDDVDSNTAGTLRWAINQSGKKIILFNTSGIIELRTSLRITKGDVSIFGQSAPGDGICIKNYPVIIEADNVIIRFLRFRLGDEKTNDAYDALTCIGRKNIMIDHCSMSWSVDECASCYDNENFTMQYCIISESLKASAHPKGNHGYGGIWGGKNASFHHNLLAHHDSRNPRFNGDRFTGIIDNEKVDFRNNVVYNWGNVAGYAGEGGYYNMVNNYYKQGPSSSNAYFYRPDSDPSNGGAPSALSNKLETIGKKGLWGKYFVEGNTMELKNGTITPNVDWNGVYPRISPGRDDMEDNPANRDIIKNQIKLLTEVNFSDKVTTQSAQDAYKAVLNFAGASLKRDAVDARIINDVINRSGSLIDTQSEVGGWATYTHTPEDIPKDTDGDKIPDEWEQSNGLNPNNPNDAKEYNGTYTNLEIYLNSLVQHLYP